MESEVIRRKRPGKKAAEPPKRSGSKSIGVFVDGVSLDRATRRLKRRVDLSQLLKALTPGITPLAARYYTLIPHEDDSRHRSFLDAVERAGMQVTVKRLPPKGSTRQVSFDPEMITDIMAFALGGAPDGNARSSTDADGTAEKPADRMGVVVVCPSRDVVYPLSVLHGLKVETIVADFESPATPDLLSAASQWVDLIAAQHIWK